MRYGAWLMSHHSCAQDFPAVLLRRMRVQAGGGTLLGSISDFCRSTGMAESTFGRRAVNDGKFVARLRDGARVTSDSSNVALDRCEAATAFCTTGQEQRSKSSSAPKHTLGSTRNAHKAH